MGWHTDQFRSSSKPIASGLSPMGSISPRAEVTTV
jgi:hypothetical protein